MGELGKAETVLAGLVAKEPKWAAGFYALGRVLFVEGKFPDAMRAVTEAERLAGLYKLSAKSWLSLVNRMTYRERLV